MIPFARLPCPLAPLQGTTAGPSRSVLCWCGFAAPTVRARGSLRGRGSIAQRATRSAALVRLASGFGFPLGPGPWDWGGICERAPSLRVRGRTTRSFESARQASSAVKPVGALPLSWLGGCEPSLTSFTLVLRHPEVDWDRGATSDVAQAVARALSVVHRGAPQSGSGRRVSPGA